MHTLDGYNGIEREHSTLTFSGMNGGNYVYHGTCSKGEFFVIKNSSLNDFIIDKSMGTINVYEVFKWPLTIGEHHDFSFRDPLASVQMHVSVEGAEKITAPAGSYDSYRILTKGQWHNANSSASGPLKEVIWYAPEISHIIKSEHTDHTNKSSIYNWYKTEMLSYQPGEFRE
ncbi:hypothetical protein [Pseudogulbenkiania subflava]|uniref:hypothetical protein n=1 Tax=Pseudogulbenkiania subflava TaxID=451637 RepID=UPI00117A1991|nr:hypothetical protein [Pseudogulbenkiania subflava]